MFIDNGKQMDVKIKNNAEALELWKGRIAEATIPPIQNLKMKSIKKLELDK